MVIASISRSLLILACSQRKRHDAELLSAIERYDGGQYRVLRKARKLNNLAANIDLLILSAKYGLIEETTLIADYEQRMTTQRAKELKIEVMQQLKSYLESNRYCEIYIDLGKDYHAAISELDKLFDGLPVIYAQGRIGERLKSLKNWLEQTSKRN